MARISDVAGAFVETLDVLRPGAAEEWSRLRAEDPDAVPMPLRALPAVEVLADLADVLRVTDMTLPRNEDEEFVRTRALAWARCRAYLPGFGELAASSEDERRELAADFARSGEIIDDEVTRSLTEIFLDYGTGYLGGGPLAWGPTAVELFLTYYVPRKVVLDAAQRHRLPGALRAWIRFALTRRGVEPRWIARAVEAVDESLPEFEEAFDDASTWGPAKQIVTELEARGVDLSDRETVERAMRELNAERLARDRQEGRFDR